jgi:phosphatidylinositol-3-phosphatase
MTGRRRDRLAALLTRRVSFAQMLMISAASAIVSLVIVVSSMGETGPERAVIAALRAGQVVHAQSPASPSAGSAQPVSDPSSSPAPASTPNSTAGSGAGGGGGGGDSGGGSGDSGGGGGSGGGGSGKTKHAQTPNPATRVKHVFLIVLSTPSYAAAFGPDSVATYLNRTLRHRGELLSHYQTLGNSPLPDRLAMVSGQAPNPDTRAGCSTYSAFASGAAPNGAGEVPGSGCIYPDTAITIGDQLDGADTPWRAYVDGMTKPCQHPDTDAADPSQSEPTSPGGALDEYATSQNPFVYFHSLLDLGDCQSDDLPFDHLAAALKTKTGTPGYAFIAPDTCDAGVETTCANGKPGGLVAADAFLRRVVPPILASPAYRANGALLIVFTAGGAVSPTTGTTTTGTTTTGTTTTGTTTTGTTTTGTSTTGTTTTTATTTTTSTTAGTEPSATSSGPLRTGALVLSRFTTRGSVDAHRYDPYSVLRSLEDIFGVSALAHAKAAGSFAAGVFSGST